MKTTIFSLILAFVASVSLAQDKKISKTFDQVKSIQLKTASGNINVVKSTSQKVQLDLTYTFDDDEFKPQFEQNGSKLNLTEDFSRGSHSGSSTWNLQVPENVAVRINSGSGNVTLEELVGEISSNVGSGDIEVSSLKGSLTLNTGSGNIEVTKSDGEVSVNAGSGNIRIRESVGDVSANAGSGNILLDKLKGQLSVNTGSGDITGKGLALTQKSKFNTGSGNATVTLAEALNYDISVNSGSGDAILNFNGQEISGEVIMTANKRGGDIVAPFKFDKEETIDDGDSSARIQKTAKIGSKDIKIKVGTGTGTAEIQK